MTSLVILIIAALPRMWAAWNDQGIFWPDEIYQSLEPAHRLVFGYGLAPWEFRDGARSWLFPGMFAVAWKAAALVGLRSAPILVRLAKLLMVLLALGGIAASMRLAKKRAGVTAAWVCGILAASFPPSLVYGARAMSEMASGPLVALAALLLWSDDRKKHWLAGVLAATAVFFRYQNGIVWLGLLAALLVDPAGRREPPRAVALRFVVGGAAVALLAGVALELITWGQPFHSLLRYVAFNLSGKNALFGPPLPATYYFTATWSAVGPSILIILAGLVVARPRWPLAIVAAYVAIHSLVPHKELRFVMPIVPLALCGAGIGLAQLAARMRHGRPVAVAVALTAAVAMSLRARAETFAQMGQNFGGHSRGDRPVWHAGEDINRLLWNVGVRPDSCGVMIDGAEPAWTGGYTYLHKRIPILWEPSPYPRASFANYLIAPRTIAPPEGYRVARREPTFWLYRRDGGCVGALERPDPPLP